MKHVKSYEAYINESHLPFEIEKTLRLDGISFELDNKRTEDDDDSRLDVVEVYVGTDRRRGVEWVVKVGEGSSIFYIEVQKDEEVVWSNKYPRSQKAHFDQDCMNTIGFLPEL